MIAATDIDRIIGSDAVDQANDKIGKVSQVYLDSDSERPTWATIKTGLFGASETLVPLDDANWDEGTLHLAVAKARVKNAPRVDPDAEISVDAQKELYAYYGFTADHRGADGHGRSDGPTPTPAPTPTPTPSPSPSPRSTEKNEVRSNDSHDSDRSDSSTVATSPSSSDAQAGKRHTGGAHVIGGADSTQAAPKQEAEHDDSLSYSRSDSDTTDLDAGVVSKSGSDDGPRTGVVGTAADRTLGGDRGRGSDGDTSARSSEHDQQSGQQQGEVRLRRYIVVEETIVAPRGSSTDDAR